MALLLRLLGIVLIAAACLTGTLGLTHFFAWEHVSQAMQGAMLPDIVSLLGFTLLLGMAGLLGIAMGGILADLDRVRHRLADPYDDHPKMAPGAYDTRGYLPES